MTEAVSEAGGAVGVPWFAGEAINCEAEGFGGISPAGADFKSIQPAYGGICERCQL